MNFLEEFKTDSYKAAIVPIPFEKTTSFQKGTKNGPNSILEASHELEIFDHKRKISPIEIGIKTFDPIKFNEQESLEDSQEKIFNYTNKVLQEKLWPIFLGGEHSISYPIIKAFKKQFADISVIQIDAHADLREQYDGTKLSHACVMKRIFDQGISFSQVGIRNYSLEENKLIEKNKLNVIHNNEINNPKFDLSKITNSLSKNIYITIDIDSLDPSIAPGTGTPEPEGLSYTRLIEILTFVFKNKNVVGADIVEVMPIPGNKLTEFIAAKIAYEMIALKFY